MFNQFQFPPAQVLAEVKRVAAVVKADQPGTDPVAKAAQVIALRLRANPSKYLEFGPYWWTVKQALRSQGEDFGDEDDPVVFVSYGGDFRPLQAMVAGEMFKDHYRANFLAGASQFWLDDQAEESYVLFDADMEARKVGPGGLLVSANLTSRPVSD